MFSSSGFRKACILVIALGVIGFVAASGTDGWPMRRCRGFEEAVRLGWPENSGLYAYFRFRRRKVCGFLLRKQDHSGTDGACVAQHLDSGESHRIRAVLFRVFTRAPNVWELPYARPNRGSSRLSLIAGLWFSCSAQGTVASEERGCPASSQREHSLS